MEVSGILPYREIASLPSLGEGKPESEDEFESVVERKPVNCINGALEDTRIKLGLTCDCENATQNLRQECKDNPVLFGKSFC